MSNIVQGSDYRFTLLTERLIRLEYSSSGEFEDRNTQLVANRDFEPVNYSVLKDHNGHEVEIETEFFHLYYDGGPFAASNLHVDAKYQYTLHDSRWYYGEKASGNLGGTNPTLDLVDGSTPIDDGIMSRDGYAYLDDTDSFAIEDGHFVARIPEESDGYFFAYGRSYREELGDYYRLSGTTPLIPRYALGNWWSRYYRYTQQEYLDLMDQFESEQVPISVSIIDMDWHRTDDVPARFGSTWTGYSWNRKLFPDPQQFLKELKKRHKHISLNTHPAGGIRAFEDAYPAVAKASVWTLRRKSRRCSTWTTRNSASPTSTTCTTRWRMRASTSGGWTGSRERAGARTRSSRCGISIITTSSTTCSAMTAKG